MSSHLTDRLVKMISTWCSEQRSLDLRWRPQDEDYAGVPDDPDCAIPLVNLWEGFARSPDAERLLDHLGKQWGPDLTFIELRLALQRLGMLEGGLKGGRALS